MFNSSQSQLTFTDDLDLISQPHDFSQMHFTDFTLPSQTQSQSDIGQVRLRQLLNHITNSEKSDDAFIFRLVLSIPYQLTKNSR